MQLYTKTHTHTPNTPHTHYTPHTHTTHTHTHTTHTPHTLTHTHTHTTHTLHTTHTHTHTHQWSALRTGHYLLNTQQTETNIHALSCIRTHNRSRPRGQYTVSSEGLTVTFSISNNEQTDWVCGSKQQATHLLAFWRVSVANICRPSGEWAWQISASRNPEFIHKFTE